MWIEDFHEFCVEELNPLSQEIMNDLLKFEADCLTLQVIYNTISTKGKLTPANQYELRKKLCPSLGYLYPECSTALEKVTNLEGLRDAVKHIEIYHKILSEIPDPEKDDEVASFNFKSLDESIYEA
jgi:V-type H+-transporting ATPase subunit d